MTEGAVKVAAHRFRARFRDLLRAEIASTVADTAESSTNSAPVTPATIRARVVFPLPGGP